VLGRATVDTWNQSGIETRVIGEFNASRPVSHFADMAVGPDGEGVFGWTAPERGLLIATETPDHATNATAEEPR
jgi:hypothetical protein